MIHRFKRTVIAALVLVVVGTHSFAAQAIGVERVVSPGGIEAWLVEDHTNPLIALNMAFKGGTVLDPEGKEGLARLVTALLDEGAGDLDAQAFQTKLEDMAIRWSFSAGQDTISGSLRTLTRNRDQAFDLLRLALTAPRFDEDAVERLRGQLISSLQQAEEEPANVAGDAMMAHLFQGHPYAVQSEGTIEGMRAITRDDLKAFVDRRFARNNLVIGVTGDITPDELKIVLDQTFGVLPETATPWVIAEADPKADGTTQVIERPVPQSSIVFAQEGMKRNDPDFYGMTVLNHILGGGGFTSRLYSEVREKRGLAYSVGTGLYPLDHAGLIWGSAGTANARVSETVQIIRSEWAQMRQAGVGAAELSDAKTYMTGSFPLRFSSSARISSILVAMQLDNLGIDYLDRRNGLIEKVTLEQVNRLAKTVLAPDKLTFVIVGQPENVTPTR